MKRGIELIKEFEGCKFADEFAAEMWDDIKFFNEFFYSTFTISFI